MINNDIAGADAAKAEMDQMLASARQQVTGYMGGDSSPVPTSGGGTYTGPYAELSNEELMRRLQGP